MNTPLKVAVTLTGSTVVALNVRAFLKFREEQKKERQRFIEQFDRETKAIWTSASVVAEKIANHEYDGKPLADMYADYEFYKIATLLQEK